jgi:predicted enzyme related to lactoylglutathione lyase
MSMGGWIWYELLTSDVAAARTFYGKVVGWDWVQHDTVPGYQMFSAQGITIGGVMALPPETGLPRPVWLGYVRVADVDAMVAAMQRDGARPCVPPTDSPGVGRFAMILDPQGVPVYVMAPQSVDGQSQSFAAKAGHCQWNELVTTDPVAAVGFYVRHMGWQKGDVMSMGPMGDYQFLIGGGQQFGAAMKRAAGAPVWRYYFGVDDIDRAARAVTDGGGTLRQDPQQVPGGAWATVAIDPQGAEFGIAGPRKG